MPQFLRVLTQTHPVLPRKNRGFYFRRVQTLRQPWLIYGRYRAACSSILSSAGEHRWRPHLPLLPQVMPPARWGGVLGINPGCEGAPAFRQCGAGLGDSTHQIKGDHGIISKTFSSTGLSEDTNALDLIRPASNTSCIRPFKLTDELLLH